MKNEAIIEGKYLGINGRTIDRIDIRVQLGSDGRIIVVCCMMDLKREVESYFEVGDQVSIKGRLPDYSNVPQFQLLATVVSKAG